jgi:RNA polymerase sigma-70 factor (ECF subfamily)
MSPDLPALLDRYERPLVRYALSIVGDLESARDVVQETFIKLARGGMEAAMPNDECRMTNGSEAVAAEEHGAGPGHSSSVIRHSSFSHTEAWLFTVTRHRALDVLRKNRRIVPMPLSDDRPCTAPGPDAALASRDTEHTLLALLDALPPNQREVIRLKFQNDLSYREIAQVTQLTETNVGFLLHTGLKKLRAMVADRAAEDFGYPIRQAL